MREDTQHYTDIRARRFANLPSSPETTESWQQRSVERERYIMLCEEAETNTAGARARMSALCRRRIDRSQRMDRNRDSDGQYIES